MIKKCLTPYKTYGPFTKAYAQPTWATLALDDRARHLARQGFSFLTSGPVRVVYQVEEGEEDKALVDVPKDGKTIGEIVLRGNIAMREVSVENKTFERAPSMLTCAAVLSRPKCYPEGLPGRVLPQWRFGRRPSRRVCGYSRPQQRHHYFWRRGWLKF